MFDWSWIGELDGAATADELASTRDMLRAAEAAQFVLAAHWADLHAKELVDDCLSALPGMPRLRVVADGCPELNEYAGAELGALLGRSPRGGEQLIRDALVLRHRHPTMWSALQKGAAPAWVAAQVGRRCVRAELPKDLAEWVDAETTPYVATLPPGQFLELVDAKIIEAAPESAEERAHARALARFVHAGRTDEYGLRTIVARANAGDVTFIVAVLDRIAHVLAERGDPRPADVLRAEALRVLANPARALALLAEATLDELDAATETPGDLGHACMHPHGDASWMVDAQGRSLPGVLDQEELPLVDLDETQLAGAGTPVLGGGSAPANNELVEAHADPALLRALLLALQAFDASRLDPVTVLHVHLAEAALTARTGVARVEELGALTLGQVRDWLTHPFSPEQIRQQVKVRPVLDAAAILPITRYEFSSDMKELATCRQPYEVSPYGTLPSRKADSDHVEPYDHDPLAPLDQTRMENQAPLGRLPHRLKTNGGWVLRHPEPGVYWWRTPHGHWFRVDRAGTHHHGRDHELDRHWLSNDAKAA